MLRTGSGPVIYRYKLAGLAVSGGGNIICPRQRLVTFDSMQSEYSSHTHNAAASHERGYEITSYQRTVLNTIVLHGSLTATGTITFTLTESGAGPSQQETYVVSMWTDSTPIYNLCGRQRESWTTFEKQTVRSWLMSSLSKAGACTMDPYSKKQQVATIFWHELQTAILGITSYATIDYGRFVMQDTQRNEANTFQGGQNTQMNQPNWGSGSGP